ncbi:eukaryotic membrane protein family-domain-containing protein [Mycotypha africana]|uniref:eukaryotic membrane protein family-domain-containing protein n=1 Tax=Mycotypha africana TaxID=64632 RepID=UPI002301F6AA|nr:eukaryotic membrane protein family-domain-containing protein [Mycotypha africana]KAI8987815.1 eukaryotic membrane protein family-domain-containing protein [Mycotypha africana]
MARGKQRLFPIDEGGWVETPKLKYRNRSPEVNSMRRAASVPTTPTLQSYNHFDLLSPTISHGNSNNNSLPFDQAVITTHNNIITSTSLSPSPSSSRKRQKKRKSNHANQVNKQHSPLINEIPQNDIIPITKTPTIADIINEDKNNTTPLKIVPVTSTPVQTPITSTTLDLPQPIQRSSEPSSSLTTLTETGVTNNNNDKAALSQMSFLDYLKDELTVADFDSAQELKRERVTNFIRVPASIEKLMLFGFFVCLDSFLYTFTILPLRFLFALYHYVNYFIKNVQALLGRRESYVRLKSFQKCDLLKGFLLLITYIVMLSLDPSRIYHAIRGQAVIKLYVLFNVLEIVDKLCCALGVDILDALFSKSTLGSPQGDVRGIAYAKRQLKPITLFLLAVLYMVLHTGVLFFQMITLNVAINFYSNALLSLLISNQFVEIKSSVFKRFEKENLFQLTCADIVERFHQIAFLFIITLRNIIEISETGPSSVLPSTFVPLFKLPASTSLNSLMTPVFMVITSELMVDWLKHAFLTKFNQIRPSIYGKYIDILCKDLVIGSPGRILSGKNNHAFVDQSPVVSRRIGFPVLPLACLYIRMMQQILPMIFMSHGQQEPTDTNAAASFVISTFSDYLIRHQDLINQLIPARIQLVVLSLVKGVWLETVLDKLFSFVTCVLVIAALAIILLALKVVVGVNLLGFAYKRYSSMEERDEREAKKDEELKALHKDETEQTTKIREYLSKPGDHILGVKPTKYTLENVDRFSMVKSRIP